jgi:hypothetical protein
VLVRFDGRYLRHDGPEHVLYFAERPEPRRRGTALRLPSRAERNSCPRSVRWHVIQRGSFSWASSFNAGSCYDRALYVEAGPINRGKLGDPLRAFMWAGKENDPSTSRGQRQRVG